MYLLESALATDSIIISLEVRAAGYYRPLTEPLPQIGAVAWVNPLEPADDCRKWLEKGAPAEQHRNLGYKRG